MKDWFKRLFVGRQGMDELSKALFWRGVLCMILAVLLYGRLKNIPSVILEWLCFGQIIWCFVRAFSKNLWQREAENNGYLNRASDRRYRWNAFRERRRQSRDFRFFKCPGCGAVIRVPKGKGRLHIKCKCGYTLYRKT